MSDIVERLRELAAASDEIWHGLYAQPMREAAHEIERLRAERDALRALLEECRPHVECGREVAERELMFAGGIASVISRATHERDACDALLDRIDAAMQEVRK